MFIHRVVLGGAFVIAWFLALFIVLPMQLGGAPTGPVLPGHEPGAPANPRLGFKFLVATGSAIALWLVFYGLVVLKVIDI